MILRNILLVLSGVTWGLLVMLGVLSTGDLLPVQIKFIQLVFLGLGILYISEWFDKLNARIIKYYRDKGK